ncbi:MAG: SPFH domain-containing protein [Polyangiaceae bacterium]
MFALSGHPAVLALGVVSALCVLVLLLLLSGFRVIPNDRIGIVEKRWSTRGSVRSGLIALHGEAGYLPDVLRGGIHYLMPIQYRVHVAPLVTIPQGRIGYVFARDGQPLSPMQALASNARANDFQNVRAFLEAGGQRGPQRSILREGTYAINLTQFIVVTDSAIHRLALAKQDDADFGRMGATIAERDGFKPVVIKGSDDLLAIVTTHDGPSLPQGEIIAPVVGDDPKDLAHYHNDFQDPERFLAAGGLRGRQLQVLVEGTYYVNRLFATVEMVPKTVVDVGTVGVVVSYTGETGADLSGDEYKHGELVEKGRRGVWSTALLPGKYAFNTYAGKVVMVPTTNFILKWNRAEVGSHRYDENLAEVSLITKDAFEPWLPLSVVVHIDYRKAPLVIQRFGDVKRLVEQTLDPMVSAYFKNVGQTRTLIQLLQDRSAIQEVSSVEMKAKFGRYNLELEEVLIGTPTSSAGDTHIEQILVQLRSRQIAEEQIETYARQEKAAVKERELREAEARAIQQTHITESELGITVQTNQGKAEYQRSLQLAEQTRALALAEADKVRMLGEAEADRSARVGVAQAIAIEEQVRAYGGPKFQLTQQMMGRFAEAIEQAKVDVVPKIVVGGGDGSRGGGNGNVLEALLTLMLSEKMGDVVKTSEPARPEVEELRARVRKEVSKGLGTNGTAKA